MKALSLSLSLSLSPLLSVLLTFCLHPHVLSVSVSVFPFATHTTKLHACLLRLENGVFLFFICFLLLFPFFLPLSLSLVRSFLCLFCHPLFRFLYRLVFSPAQSSFLFSSHLHAPALSLLALMPSIYLQHLCVVSVTFHLSPLFRR